MFHVWSWAQNQRGAGFPGRNTGHCYQKELNRSQAAGATGVSITGRQDQSKRKKKIAIK